MNSDAGYYADRGGRVEPVFQFEEADYVAGFLNLEYYNREQMPPFKPGCRILMG